MARVAARPASARPPAPSGGGACCGRGARARGDLRRGRQVPAGPSAGRHRRRSAPLTRGFCAPRPTPAAGQAARNDAAVCKNNLTSGLQLEAVLLRRLRDLPLKGKITRAATLRLATACKD